MKLVLGLGNPGARYRRTRHNVGFEVVDLLLARDSVEAGREREIDRKLWWCEARRGACRFVLAKPLTYMNRSGGPAHLLLRKFNAKPEDLIVVYDDADLELGRVRIRPEGGAGGHNGIRSLMDRLHGGGFARVRLGVRGAGRDDEDLADYVLRRFDGDERETVAEMLETGADAVLAVLTEGIEPAMNRYNGTKQR